MDARRAIDAEPDTIEALQRRWRDLDTRRIQSERDVQHLSELLEEERRKAREQFGTDDLAALEEKLARMKRENLERRRAYQAHLDGIEAALGAIEAAHEAALAAPLRGAATGAGKDAEP
jgi:hypothetical protein